MAFKLSYSFEGNSKSKPEQNLSGASKKLTRDVLLQKTHDERRKRQEHRVKVQSATLLQSHIRSYLIRKHVKDSERVEYDSLSHQLSVDNKIKKILFFFDTRQDSNRLHHLAEHLVVQNAEVQCLLHSDVHLRWCVNRFLALCIKHIKHFPQLMLEVVNIYSEDSQTLFYLVRKGYFSHLREVLDQSFGQILENIKFLIYKPFKYLKDYGPSQDLVLSEFCSNFLEPALSNNVKNHLFPYFQEIKDNNYYERLVRYLNSGFHHERSNNLFYSILILEPKEYELSLEYIQVLSTLSKDLYRLGPALLNVSSEDSDSESEFQESDQEVLLSDYLTVLNKPEKVKKWLSFFNNYENDSVLTAYVNLCQNLFLVYHNSIRRYLLLYRLGLNNIMLENLWKMILKKEAGELQIRGSSLVSWKQCHTNFSVFCNFFTFYTENLTDAESCDTSETFSPQELSNMAKLLKDVALDLVEVAYPMCRSSTVPVTPEVLHLYKSCLKCVKVLYMLDMRKQFCPAGSWTARKFHVSLDLARRNYLSKSNPPFGQTIQTYDEDDQLPPLSTIEQRSLAVLQELPFLVPFNTRVLLLRDLCRHSIAETDYQRMHRELTSDNIVIRRNYLYEDAFEKISPKTNQDMKHTLRIQFINNIGLDEAGIDGGGIFKEFINETVKTAFDPNRGFFMMTADNTLYPNPNVNLIVSNFEEHYNFMGKLVGKAIFENILVDLPLAEFFLAKLLVNKASAHYLRSLDPILYRNLLYLRDYNGDVSDLGLDFTTVNNVLGETRIVELTRNGRNIPVVRENRLEYIQKLADYKLNKQLDRQCAAFKEGLDSVVPLSWLKLFNHNDLQVIISGDNQEIDLSDLRAHTVYSGEFTADHPTILNFWKILYSFTESQKKKLLKFVTSCSRPPLLGFKELNPQFCIQSSGNENRMPSASTCLNLLKIPIIMEEELLKSKLLNSIEQNAGFELS